MTTYRSKTNPDRRIDVIKMTDESVTFCSQGGGFQSRASRANFDRDFEPATTPVWRRGYVSAEWMEGVRLPCWSNGEKWNGWSMPAFSEGPARHLRAALKTAGGTPIEWVFNGKYVVADMGEELEYYPRQMMDDGTEVWPIGAGSWCWDSVTIIPTIEESIARIKREILDMIKAGHFTAERACCDFGDLPIDANMLGGFGDDDLFDSMILHYGGRDEHEGMPQGMLDHINAAQEAVHQWLARKDHLKELK